MKLQRRLHTIGVISCLSFLWLTDSAWAVGPTAETGPVENRTVIEVPTPDGGGCPGIVFLNDDGTYENAYSWQFGGVAPPDYGAWAEYYANPYVCEAHFYFTTIAGYQAGQLMDVYIWQDDGLTNPGNVVCMLPGVDPGPVGIAPDISTHKIALNCCTGGDHFIGYWPNWVGAAPGWFVAADEDGPGTGNPRTNIAPGIGYPTGWQHPSVVPGFANIKDIALGEWALPDCPADCQYPPGGPDWFESSAHFTVNWFDPPMSFDVWVEGPTHVIRGDPYLQGSMFRIDTEITSLELRGISCFGPIDVRLNPTIPSTGAILQTDPSECYPADSFFDIFLTLCADCDDPLVGAEGEPIVLHNTEPIRMETQINSIPPYDDEYEGLGPIELFDDQGELVATLKNETHIVHPPHDCFFSNGFFETLSLGQLQLDPNIPQLTDVRRDAPRYNSQTGQWDTDWEVTWLDLRSDDSPFGPVIVRESPDLPSVGQIHQPGFDQFPAEAYVDLFFEIEVPNEEYVLINLQPVRITSVQVNGFPPTGSKFTGGEVELFDKDNPNGPPVDFLTFLSHTPKEPFDWTPPPPPGNDCFCSMAQVTIELIDLGVFDIDLTGPTMVQRDAPTMLGDGRVAIPTEMVELDLSGEHPELGPVSIQLDPFFSPSTGGILQQARGPLFPADCQISVFVGIDVQGQHYRSLNVDMAAVINDIPPTEMFQSQNQADLFDENFHPVGRILSVTHGPLVPYDWACPIPPPCLPGASRVDEPDLPEPGRALALHPVLPNPTNGGATIRFDLERTGPASVKIYDVRGRLVRTLVDGSLEGGKRYEYEWDRTTDKGGEVHSGVFFVKLASEGNVLSRKVLLMPR